MTQPCSVVGCTAPRFSRDYCRQHAYRARRYGDPLAASPRARARLTQTLLRDAIAGLRRGLSMDAAAAEAGFTGRALRNHFTALGVSSADFKPTPPESSEPDRRERVRRLARIDRERKWAAQREQGTRTYNVHTGGGRRRDLHILLTPEAVEEVQVEAERRQCSLSALVNATLAEAGIISDV